MKKAFLTALALMVTATAVQADDVKFVELPGATTRVVLPSDQKTVQFDTEPKTFWEKLADSNKTTVNAGSRMHGDELKVWSKTTVNGVEYKCNGSFTANGGKMVCK